MDLIDKPIDNQQQSNMDRDMGKKKRQNLIELSLQSLDMAKITENLLSFVTVLVLNILAVSLFVIDHFCLIWANSFEIIRPHCFYCRQEPWAHDQAVCKSRTTEFHTVTAFH